MVDASFQKINIEAQEMAEGSPDIVNVLAIALASGAQCEDKPLDTDILGFVIRQAGGWPHIYANAGLKPHQQRFAIARSLGHIYLAGQGDLVAIDRSHQPESSADVFARALLMPWNKVSDLRSRGVNATEMSLVFEVSGTNVTRRLDDLGLS